MAMQAIGNGVVAVLAALPHDLFFSIAEEWIEQHLFITFVVLDTAAQDNKALKAYLLSHYKFMQSSNQLKFSYSIDRGGYYCDVLFHLQRYCTRLTKELTFDVHGLVTTASMDSVYFTNCCTNLKVVRWLGGSFTQLLPSIVSSLEQIRLYDDYVSLDDDSGCALSSINKNCRNLKKLIMHSKYVDANVHDTIVEIVKANHGLQELKTAGKIGLLDVIYSFCPEIESIDLKLPVNIEPSLKQVGKLFEKAQSKLRNCFLSFCRRFYFSISIPLYVDFDISFKQYTAEDVMWFFGLMNEANYWSFQQAITDETVMQVVELSADVMTRIASMHSEQLTLEALCNMFQRCSKLENCALYKSLTCCDVVKLLQYAPTTLKTISLDDVKLTVTAIIAILQTCGHFEYCRFDNVVNDALTDPILY